MTQTFYTSVENAGKYILFRGVENGKRIKRKIEYKPSLFVKTTKDTPFRTIHGERLEELQFDNIWDARAYIKRFRDVSNAKIYGNQNFVYSFLTECFPDGCEHDASKILVGYIDIEVGSENGFPRPEDAIEPVTAITVLLGSTFFVFGCGDFDVPTGPDGKKRKDIQYVKCSTEEELLQSFLWVWNKYTPDIISGWSIEKFDIPYLVNRCKRLFPDDTYAKLSPWGIVNERIIYVLNREIQVYDLVGIATLDYFDLYKKYAPHPNQESHKLGDIGWVEIKEGKINYDEYGTLHTLYKRNYQRFIEYNIQDTALVKKINNKMRLIELAITMAYDNHINYQDVFSQGRMWDAIIYNYLRKNDIIVPPKNRAVKKVAFAGGYVKEPKPGMYGWGVAFDLDGLYPHLIMQYNMSPDTLVEMSDLPVEVITWFNANRANISVNRILDGKLDMSILKQYKLTMTPNGAFFTTAFQGFLPKLMETYYADRKKYKKEMLKYEKLIEADKENEEYKLQRTKNDNFQKAKKVTLNAAYGSVGNEFFRFFDVRIAEGITLAGQLSVRWVAKFVNEYMNTTLKTDDVDYIVASDTDSIYVSLEALVKTVAATKTTKETSEMMDDFIENKIGPVIQSAYEQLADLANAYQQKMIMKRESIFNRAVWTGKKRYFLNIVNGEGGVIYDPPKLKIVGNEAVKSSTPAVCRDALKKAFDIIMNQDQATLRKFVQEFNKKFIEMPLQDIASPKSCNDLSGWANKPAFKRMYNVDTEQFTDIAKSCPYHVKGALIYNQLIEDKKLTTQYRKIMDGEKIKYMPMKEPNPTQSDVISFPAILPDELDLREYLDYDAQFQKSYISPLSIVTNAIGWSLEEQSSLDGLWG